ncbi:hypothetical protein JCM31185_11470 [Furfurilactobacillus curtus]|uniref:Type II secretion system protein n=1 Tax=Furfurilactobacillus curtus TaxID=1746200 RepID=A0ABQ5JMW2_9LACO
MLQKRQSHRTGFMLMDSLCALTIATLCCLFVAETNYMMSQRLRELEREEQTTKSDYEKSSHRWGMILSHETTSARLYFDRNTVGTGDRNFGLLHRRAHCPTADT